MLAICIVAVGARRLVLGIHTRPLLGSPRGRQEYLDRVSAGAWPVHGTAGIRRGSSESKDPGTHKPVQDHPRETDHQHNVPWPIPHGRGVARPLRTRSSLRVRVALPRVRSSGTRTADWPRTTPRMRRMRNSPHWGSSTATIGHGLEGTERPPDPRRCAGYEPTSAADLRSHSRARRRSDNALRTCTRRSSGRDHQCPTGPLLGRSVIVTLVLRPRFVGSRSIPTTATPMGRNRTSSDDALVFTSFHELRRVIEVRYRWPDRVVEASTDLRPVWVESRDTLGPDDPVRVLVPSDQDGKHVLRRHVDLDTVRRHVRNLILTPVLARPTPFSAPNRANLDITARSLVVAVKIGCCCGIDCGRGRQGTRMRGAETHDRHACSRRTVRFSSAHERRERLCTVH